MSFHRIKSPVLWGVIILSTLAISHAIFQITLAVEGDQWSMVDARWAKLIGLLRDHSLKSPSIIYFLVVQLVAALVAVFEVYGSRFGLDLYRNLCLGHLLSSFEHIALVVGSSHPSWVSLPFFICSCIGLIDWSLTSNFLGLFSLNIVLLYVYQLPGEFSCMFQWHADFIGLYKISAKSNWSEICSGVSLLLFYFMLSCIRYDLVEMDIIMSTRETSLTEQLLPLKHSFLIHELRSGVRHTNVMLRGAVFRTFSINFFTYGLPVLNKELQKDMDVWETIGLWHYPIPGFFIFAQFCLGILVAMSNLVNSSVFLYLSDGDAQSTNDNCTVEVLFVDTTIPRKFGLGHRAVQRSFPDKVNSEEPEVMIVATIAWGLCKSSRAIVLTLIFSIALKPGFIHAVYMVFFMIYLLSHTISRRIRQYLILLCEAHFVLKYILQLNLISKALEEKGSLALEIISQLGLLDHASSGDFVKIAGLACFCSVYNHGSDMLFSYSTIVQHTPFPPIGWSILKAGLNKSVLLSVYTPSSREREPTNSFNGIIVSKAEYILG
ncbi:unnamed protein product [Camellia sinensis]